MLEGIGADEVVRVAAPIPCLAWTLRLEPLVAASTNKTMLLFNPLIPAEHAETFLAEEVFSRTAKELGVNRILFVMGTRSGRRHGVLSLPDSDMLVGVLLLRSAGSSADADRRVLADTRRMYDRLVELGGKRYPWDSVPDLSRADWARHFGPHWGQLKRAKRRHDPAGILGPGHRIFAP